MKTMWQAGIIHGTKQVGKVRTQSNTYTVVKMHDGCKGGRGETFLFLFKDSVNMAINISRSKMFNKLSFQKKKKPHCFVAYPFYYFKLRRISNGHTTDGGFLSALVLKGCRLSDLGRTNICFSLWKKKMVTPFWETDIF